MFVGVHLAKLIELGSHQLQEKPAIKPARWMKGIKSFISPTPLHEELVTRTKILGNAQGTCFGTEEIAVCVFAWGGMHRHHAAKVFQERGWLRIAEEIRAGRHTRSAAYDLLAALHTPCMGPAFFTKLIYFLMPRGGCAGRPGYIMDQWLGCSVNLLVGDPRAVLMDAVHQWVPSKRNGPTLTTRYLVSRLNTGRHYERFCCAIDALADHRHITPDEAEVMLFSAGKGKGAWRTYVIATRQPAPAT